MLLTATGRRYGGRGGGAAYAYDSEGRRVVGELGEPVISEPMPSTPAGSWGDADGARHRAAYFEEHRAPGRSAR